MTTALLILLVLIELARLVLQYKQGKAYREQTEKTYCEASKAENAYAFVERSHLQRELDSWGHLGYEIVSVVDDGSRRNGDHYFLLFFTKKRIKNFTENG